MENKIMWLLSPALRWEIFATLKELANKELQLIKWINPNYKYSFWSELLFCIDTLFNDANALGKTSQIKVGLTMYNQKEVEEVNRFCHFFYNLTEEIKGEKSDIDYYGHPQWQKIIDDAAKLVEIMERNNKANDFSECLSQFNQFNIEGYEDYDDFAIAKNTKNGYKFW
ncbi:MAG: hypothetical protein RCO49_05695 [Rickettsia endosymbiont of Argas persicus]